MPCPPAAASSPRTAAPTALLAVRTELVAGVEQPAQLIRSGRLWSVRQPARVDRRRPGRDGGRAVGDGTAPATVDQVVERWRVHVADRPGGPLTVLDLSRLADGTWQLVGADA